MAKSASAPLSSRSGRRISTESAISSSSVNTPGDGAVDPTVSFAMRTPSTSANPATTAVSLARAAASRSSRGACHQTSATPSLAPDLCHSASTARAAARPHGAMAGCRPVSGGGPVSSHRSSPVNATRCSAQSSCGGSRRHRLDSVPPRPSAPSISSAPSASSSHTATATAPNRGRSCSARAPTSSAPSRARSAARTAAGSSASRGSWSGSASSGPVSDSCLSTAAAISCSGIPAAAAMSVSSLAASVTDQPCRSISTPLAIAMTAARSASTRASASSRR